MVRHRGLGSNMSKTTKVCQNCGNYEPPKHFHCSRCGAPLPNFTISGPVHPHFASSASDDPRRFIFFLLLGLGFVSFVVVSANSTFLAGRADFSIEGAPIEGEGIVLTIHNDSDLPWYRPRILVGGDTEVVYSRMIGNAWIYPEGSRNFESGGAVKFIVHMSADKVSSSKITFSYSPDPEGFTTKTFRFYPPISMSPFPARR